MSSKHKSKTTRRCHNAWQEVYYSQTSLHVMRYVLGPAILLLGMLRTYFSHNIKETWHNQSQSIFETAINSLILGFGNLVLIGGMCGLAHPNHKTLAILINIIAEINKIAPRSIESDPLPIELIIQALMIHNILWNADIDTQFCIKELKTIQYNKLESEKYIIVMQQQEKPPIALVHIPRVHTTYLTTIAFSTYFAMTMGLYLHNDQTFVTHQSLMTLSAFLQTRYYQCLNQKHLAIATQEIHQLYSDSSKQGPDTVVTRHHYPSIPYLLMSHHGDNPPHKPQSDYVSLIQLPNNTSAYVPVGF